MYSHRLTLYSGSSPAAQCVSVALEELDISYEVKTLSLKDREQKSEWYLQINPNGRLPALIDHSEGDFTIWESSAILLYIAQHFDTERKISYDPVSEPKLYSEQLQWVFFAHGGIAPIHGQLYGWNLENQTNATLNIYSSDHFMCKAPETLPYAVARYKDELKRLISVLEKRLEKRAWLVGPHYSLADIKTFLWVRLIEAVKLNLNDYPNVHKWIKRIEARPKTDKGMGIPERLDLEAYVSATLEETRAWGATLFGFKKME